MGAEKSEKTEEEGEAPKEKAKKLAKARPRTADRREVPVLDLEGNPGDKVPLPVIFTGAVRTDLIRRAVVASQANRRQPYGASPRAGMRHSTSWSGKGQGVSRSQRLKGSNRGAQSPEAVGGRRAFPPQVEKIWAKKINTKERRLARESALAAVADATRVKARGHRWKEGLDLPLIISDSIEETARTKDLEKVLTTLGVHDDLARARDGIHIRAGRGKMRGRRRRTPSSLLLVVGARRGIELGARNLPGVDVATVHELNTELLAPGGDPGRLTLFTESAIAALEKGFGRPVVIGERKKAVAKAREA